jgi:biopolymer transport protein ExbD
MKEGAPMPKQEKLSNQYPDVITVRVAHDKSLYIVYSGKVPPIYGQEYVSIRQHADALAAARREARESADTEARYSVVVNMIELARNCNDLEHFKARAEDVLSVLEASLPTGESAQARKGEEA